MSAVSVLAARYLFKKLRDCYPTLPAGADDVPRMHEFILTLTEETLTKIEASGTKRSSAISRIGKLFLDFGLHAPTVAFPEVYGLMVEPTESYSKEELDRFIDIVKTINLIVNENPEVLQTVPHFTPVDRIDDLTANKQLCLSGPLTSLPEVLPNRVSITDLNGLATKNIWERIVRAHEDFEDSPKQ